MDDPFRWLARFLLRWRLVAARNRAAAGEYTKAPEDILTVPGIHISPAQRQRSGRLSRLRALACAFPLSVGSAHECSCSALGVPIVYHVGEGASSHTSLTPTGGSYV